MSEVLDALPMDPEDSDLEFARRLRISLANDIAENGIIPDDRRDRRLLLEVLDGIDNSAIQRKKIKTESDNANKSLVAAATIAEIFNTKDVKRLSVDELRTGTIKTLDEAIPDAPVAPGELSDNDHIDVEEFMGRLEHK